MPNSSKYGYFSPDGTEFIITNPKTPTPWINYLVNDQYFALVSHTGGGYSFVTDPTFNRITREYPGDSISSDRPGRYLFIRDNETGEFWSANWQPVNKKTDFWEGRIGLGYNKIVSINQQIKSEITYFVPQDDQVEFWQVSIKNNSSKKRDLSLFTYVEWVLGSYVKDLTDRSFDSLFNNVFFEENIIFATKRRWERPDQNFAWDKWAFISGDTKWDSFDCVKAEFIGLYQYLSSPLAVERGECKNSQGESEDAIGSLMKRITLEANQEFKLNIILGVAENKEKIREIVEKYSKKEEVEEKFNDLKQYWQEYLSRLWVKTPDREFDLTVNVWSKYQAWVTSHLGEVDSYYIGSGSLGFRDQCQNIFGVLPQSPEFAKKWLITLMEHQFQRGKTVHSWNQTTGEISVTDHSDDAQWLVMSVLNYLKETGDLGFLKEEVKYLLDEGEGSVLEHILKAMDYTLDHLGKSGIPLRRTADWNDALAGGHLGRGESAMVGNQVCFNITELLKVLEKLDNQEKMRVLIKKYQEVRENMKKVLNEDYWDGEWFIRASDDGGNLIGSKKSVEGKITLNSQTWPIISGVASLERGKQAMDSAWKHLDSPFGLIISWPSYTHLSEGLGIISQFAPGTKENGTIFLHTNAWAIIAECLLGRGDKAYEIFRRTSFINRGKDPDTYKAEPYVYSEFIYGPDSPHFGQGSYSWITGSATWFYRAFTDWILGVRPTMEGLLIDPCVSGWEEFEIKRTFRGAIYQISFHNPGKVYRGVLSIEVDGQKIEGNLLPVFKEGKHRVTVEMGRK